MGRMRALPAFWLALYLVSGNPSSAQPLKSQPKAEAPLIVEGVVREIFVSPRRSADDVLVHVRCRASSLGAKTSEPIRLTLPAPGDDVYIHLTRPRSGDPQRGNPGHREPPGEGTNLKAFLYPRPQGGWAGAFPDWFDRTAGAASGDELSDLEPADDAPDEPSRSPARSEGVENEVARKLLNTLGMSGTFTEADGRLTFRVDSVANRSKAQVSGVEMGDTIVEMNGAPLGEPARLVDAVRRGAGKITLSVLDIRTGNLVPVELEGEQEAVQAAGDPGPDSETRPAQRRGSRALGVKVEPVNIGLRNGLRVTAVQPGSPAQAAGIQDGDVISDVDGLPVSSQPSLIDAIERAGNSVELTVRDQGRGQGEEVKIEMSDAPPPAPSDSPSHSDGSRIGLSVEQVFADGRLALKITQVRKGGAAEKAGIQVGDVITGVGGQPVENLDQFAAAVSRAGNALRFDLIDVNTGQAASVNVSTR